MDSNQKARKKDFENELRDLLNKHSVTLNLTDDGKIYGMHSPVLELQFDTAACSDFFDVDFSDFDLG